MRRFRYLIGRITASSLNGLMGLIFLILLLQTVLSPVLFSYRNEGIVRVRESGHGSFQFISGMDTDRLLPKYHQAEYIRDLNRYLGWLRSEIALYDEAGNDRVWLAHLKQQQQIHNQTLRVVMGVTTPESYYFNHYLEPLLIDSEFSHSLFPVRPDDPEWQSLLERVLRRDYTSGSTHARVTAMNILEELPLRLDSISASSLTLELRSSGKILLLFIPFLAFLVLFAEPDRNLRKETPFLILEKTLAVFLYSFAALGLIFGLLYLFLRIRHGDPEGAMYVIPPWNLAPRGILTLKDLLMTIAAMDLIFLFFVSLLLATLHTLVKNAWAAGALALGLLLLPSVAALPSALPSRLFLPFHYFQWEVSPLSLSVLPDQLMEAAGPELAATPGEVLNALLFGGIFLIGIIFLVSLVKEKRKTRSVRNEKERT